jgi:hypothetical protein
MPDIGTAPRATKIFKLYQNSKTKRWGFEGPAGHKCAYYSEKAARIGIRNFCLDNNIACYQVIK